VNTNILHWHLLTQVSCRQVELAKVGLFPPPPPDFIKAVSPYCELLGFKSLASHLHVVVGAALFYQSMFLVSPFISSMFKSYNALRTRSKINWDIHVVSMIQCVLICFLAFFALGDPQLKGDRVFGYSAFGADVSALACGYFVWDTYVSFKYIKLFGVGFALHGLASLAVFLFGFVPPVNSVTLTLASFPNVLWTCGVALRTLDSFS
jgi:TLC domain